MKEGGRSAGPREEKKMELVRSTAEADYYAFFGGIENGRKSDFRPAKKIATSSFDVPPYRDFVILIIFHGGISRKIRTELHGTRRSAPRRVE